MIRIPFVFNPIDTNITHYSFIRFNGTPDNIPFILSVFINYLKNNNISKLFEDNVTCFEFDGNNFNTNNKDIKEYSGDDVLDIVVMLKGSNLTIIDRNNIKKQ